MVITGKVTDFGAYSGGLGAAIEGGNVNITAVGLSKEQFKAIIDLSDKQIKITIKEDLDSRHERWDETV